MKLMSATSLALPAGKRDVIYFDDDLTGFGLRLRRGSGGRIIRNWIVQYRARGRGRRMLIGSAEKVSQADARKKARKLLAEVELGGDPQADKAERREKDDVTLRSVIKDYLAHKEGEIKARSMVLLRGYLEGPLYLKRIHGLPIDQVSRRDVAKRLLDVSKENGTHTAIALRSALSSMFAWAMEMGLTEHNPVVGAFKPKMPKPRDRVLSDGELAAIWRGCKDDDYGKCIRLLMLTGCRREEIAGMRWSEFDFAKGEWTLPASRSKNGRPHTLPLTPAVESILEAIPRRDRTDLLFGRKHGFTGWSIGKRELDERLGLPSWRVHDIRRTVATRMADLGIKPHIVEQVLNHQSGHRRGVAGTYNRSVYEREVRQALTLWSDHVQALVEGRERKVIAFPAATDSVASAS